MYVCMYVCMYIYMLLYSKSHFVTKGQMFTAKVYSDQVTDERIWITLSTVLAIHGLALIIVSKFI